MPGWASNCNGKIDTAQAFINNTLPGRLNTLYSSIRSRRLDRQGRGGRLPADLQRRGLQRGDLLLARPRRPGSTRWPTCSTRSSSAAASARGFTFANPTSRFIGHAVCDDVEWLNGLSNPIGESYHPNRPGHSSGYTPLISPLLS